MSEATAERPYSELWFSTFLDTIDPAQTALEVAFLERHLPLPQYRRIVDLCCGPGRHAVPLSQRGHEVTGVDRDPGVIARARRMGQHGAVFVEADVRTTTELEQSWDGVIVMWASFGYFAPAENRRLLARIRTALRLEGRLVLDVYNRDFFSQHSGERRVQRAGREVIEHRQLIDDRLTVELRYAGYETSDRFSWQIFRPDDLVLMVAALGYEPLVLCAAFDENVAVTSEHPRMQLVAQRPS
jgi:SAM-dependent methyltransferase